MYSISFEKQVVKFLSKLDKKVSQRIISKIKLLRNNPVPPDAKRLVNVPDKAFRIRVGKFRVLYRIEGKKLVIVFAIDKRSRVYN